MTTEEFSDQFDVLFNNVTSNLAPGLNEYEKSVFLTNALDEIVLTIFTSFDKNSHVLADFSNLIRTVKMIELNHKEYMTDYLSFDPRASLYYIPNEYHSDGTGTTADNDIEGTAYSEDSSHEEILGEENFDNVLIIINELIVIKSDTSPYDVVPNGIRQVIPVPYDEWTRLMSKPFKYPNKYLAWRLLEGRYDNDNTWGQLGIKKLRRNVAIILNPADSKRTNVTREYILRYVKRPRPIVLADFTDAGVSFSTDNKYTKKTECELDPILHRQILLRAVEMAKAAWAVSGQDRQLQLQLQ